MKLAFDRSEPTLIVACSRCLRSLRRGIPGGMTSGYYLATGWPQFCDPSDVAVCDECMWSDPRYIAVYGRVLR